MNILSAKVIRKEGTSLVFPNFLRILTLHLSVPVMSAGHETHCRAISQIKYHT